MWGRGEGFFLYNCYAVGLFLVTLILIEHFKLFCGSGKRKEGGNHLQDSAGHRVEGQGNRTQGGRVAGQGLICDWRILQAKEREEEGLVLLGTQWLLPFPLDDLEVEAQWRQGAHSPHAGIRPISGPSPWAWTWRCPQVWRQAPGSIVPSIMRGDLVMAPRVAI